MTGLILYRGKITKTVELFGDVKYVWFEDRKFSIATYMY